MSGPTITNGVEAAPGPAEPIHQPPSWVEAFAEGDDNAHFAALTLDVCNGVKTCMQLIHSTDLAVNSGAGGEDPPILGVLDKEHLVLLASAAVRMLGDRAFAQVGKLNDRARKSAREGSSA